MHINQFVNYDSSGSSSHDSSDFSDVNFVSDYSSDSTATANLSPSNSAYHQHSLFKMDSDWHYSMSLEDTAYQIRHPVKDSSSIDIDWLQLNDEDFHHSIDSISSSVYATVHNSISHSGEFPHDDIFSIMDTVSHPQLSHTTDIITKDHNSDYHKINTSNQFVRVHSMDDLSFNNIHDNINMASSQNMQLLNFIEFLDA
jgi:hypothetical protein